MTTKPRTLEEIAWDTTGESCDFARGEMGSRPSICPNSIMCGPCGLVLHIAHALRKAADAARQEEWAALREWIEYADSWDSIKTSAVRQWLDARSRDVKLKS